MRAVQVVGQAEVGRLRRGPCSGPTKRSPISARSTAPTTERSAISNNTTDRRLVLLRSVPCVHLERRHDHAMPAAARRVRTMAYARQRQRHGRRRHPTSGPGIRTTARDVAERDADRLADLHPLQRLPAERQRAGHQQQRADRRHRPRYRYPTRPPVAERHGDRSGHARREQQRGVRHQRERPHRRQAQLPRRRPTYGATGRSSGRTAR